MQNHPPLDPSRVPYDDPYLGMGVRIMRGFQFSDSSIGAGGSKWDTRSGRFDKAEWTERELEKCVAAHYKLHGGGRTRRLICEILGRTIMPKWKDVPKGAYGLIITALCHDMITRENAYQKPAKPKAALPAPSPLPQPKSEPPKEEA